MGASRNFSRVLLFAIDNLSAMAFGLLGGAFLARIFGPEDLGRLGTVQAATALLVCLTTLGLDHYWVRELHRRRDDGGLIATLQLTQSLGWLAHLLALLGVSWLFGHLDRDWVLVLAVVVTTFFTRTLFVSLYFNATGHPQPIAVSAVFSRLLALAYLAWGFSRQLSYEWMVLYLPLQAALQGGYLAWRFWQEAGRRLVCKLEWPRVAALLREAAPMLLATALFPLFAQADVLVVAHFLGDREVGVYAAATRLLPQLLFLGHVLAAAFFPLIIARHDARAGDYIEHVLRVARVIAGLAMLASLAVAVLAPTIVSILYGARFADSVAVLQVVCLTWVFMLPAALYSRLLILEGLARVELFKTLMTAMFSVAMNLWLVPRHGILAAAWVSVGAYFLADMALYGVFRSTRPLFLTSLRALSDWFVRPLYCLRDARLLLGERS